MDRNKVKRPRSSTPNKGDKQSVSSSPLKKKSKKEKVGGGTSSTGKSKRFRADSEAAAAASGDGAGATSNAIKLKKGTGSSTATADGQIMAQMISTFSKQEEARFEAFQRSSFQADAIEEFVAACICHRHGILRGGGGEEATAGPSNQPQQHRRSRPPVRPRLQDLVSAPGPTVAQDVVIVVSTLAKIYAQRLVSAAVQISNARQAREQQKQQRNEDGDKSDGDANEDLWDVGAAASSALTTEQPLEPHDVLEAHRQRVSAGLDPGFYLQGHDGISTATSVVAAAHAPLANGVSGGTPFNQSNHLGGASALLQHHRRVAALALQEEYDKSRSANTNEGDGIDADVSMKEADDGAGAEEMEAEVEPPETMTTTTTPPP